MGIFYHFLKLFQAEIFQKPFDLFVFIMLQKCHFLSVKTYQKMGQILWIFFFHKLDFTGQITHIITFSRDIFDVEG